MPMAVPAENVVMMNELPEDKLEEIAEQIPPEVIAILKKVVAAAEEHQKSKPAGGKGDAIPDIKKIGNSDEASEMKRAIFMWDEEVAKQALGQLLKGKKVPEKVNGPMLVMEQVEWADAADGKSWPAAMKKCAYSWFCDQGTADKPFEPPAKAKENCAYLWDEKTADEWLEKNGFKKVGLKGKALLDDTDRSGAFSDMDECDKVWEKLQDLSVQFMKDVVKAA